MRLWLHRQLGSEKVVSSMSVLFAESGSDVAAVAVAVLIIGSGVVYG